MIIALDYDDTFTVDKKLWSNFVFDAKNRGHEVSFVTFRFDEPLTNTDIIADSELLGIQVVYTGGMQKEHKFQADIWIDDNPCVIPTYLSLKHMVIGCENLNDLSVEEIC